ncbi:MAG: twin-arginine translocase TatA/TatE family subunit [Coriobacteriia bacterium]|nr:twin-arginine translocase TatA/TatE family subunit [Coriobacteriia bacterium]MCL2606571.1 twin-arginine translocase TatA/TatE family subunit [Coriobacteriia bacterium]
MYLLGAWTPGPLELIVLLVVVLVIFGPKQLPKLGKMLGKTMQEVRGGLDEANKTLEHADEPVVLEPVPSETSADTPAATESAPAAESVPATEEAKTN